MKLFESASSAHESERLNVISIAPIETFRPLKPWVYQNVQTIWHLLRSVALYFVQILHNFYRNSFRTINSPNATNEQTAEKRIECNRSKCSSQINNNIMPIFVHYIYIYTIKNVTSFKAFSDREQMVEMDFTVKHSNNWQITYKLSLRLIQQFWKIHGMKHTYAILTDTRTHTDTNTNLYNIIKIATSAKCTLIALFPE